MFQCGYFIVLVKLLLHTHNHKCHSAIKMRIKGQNRALNSVAISSRHPKMSSIPYFSWRSEYLKHKMELWTLICVWRFLMRTIQVCRKETCLQPIDCWKGQKKQLNISKLSIFFDFSFTILQYSLEHPDHIRRTFTTERKRKQCSMAMA